MRRQNSELSVRKAFRIRLGRALAGEYHDRPVKLGRLCSPGVLPHAALYGADDAPLLRVSICLPVSADLMHRRGAAGDGESAD